MAVTDHIMVTGESLVTAYHTSLVALRKEGRIVECPAWNTRCIETAMTMHIQHPLQEPMISGLSICEPYSLEKYRLEMLNGLLDWAIEAGLEPYTYHRRYEVQYEAAIAELRRDPNSRRAAMTVRYPDDWTIGDPPCLQHIQFMIRDGALNCYVVFRSNDAAKAAFMNMFALAMLQKKAAEELEIPVGTMLYTANSYHCYERDWETLDAYVQAIEEGTAATYSYEDDWREMMDYDRAQIYADVQRQKQNAEDRAGV